jgi:transcriptional regulator NrdR family protein
VDTEASLLVSSAGRLEPFSRDKLLIDVYDSLRHRKTALADATALTLTIWSQLQGPIEEGLIDREEIIKTVASVLKRFDKAAATHYLAFHPISPVA